jgi:phosphopantothenoylcysteine decarboxylase/phosphopantothenate--cysteine ligase
MNRLMWDNAATRANVALLAARGVRMIGPEAGEQACGEVGPGRMSEPETIVGALFDVPPAGALSGLSVLITAGPTQEPIDPVRFITNRSSGKMGYAVASAAAGAGARVTLVSGPTALAVPAGVDVRRVTTAAEMYEAVMAEVAAQDIFIASAAVADYRPEAPATQKMKKAGAALTLTLAPTQDILRAVAAREKPPFTVGFAAETEHVLENARSKLTGKSLDMIAANKVGAGIGFDSDENELHVIWQDGDTLLGRASKNSIARRLVELIAARYRAVRG